MSVILNKIMSSPNIKVQTLIRKIKNGAREALDKKKIINEYTYNFTIEDVLTTSILFKEKEKSSFEYDLFTDIEYKLDSAPPKRTPSKPINITNAIDKVSPESQETLILLSPDISSDVNLNPDFIHKDSSLEGLIEDVENYVGEGYFKNIYNAESCDIDWIIMTYCINRLYLNFTTIEKVKIKSLHLNAKPYAELSALNHFLFNSKIQQAHKIIEWDWVATNSNKDKQGIDTIFREKYKDSILHLFTPQIKNSINYIINETGQRIGKLNLLCVNQESGIYEYVCYAIFSIKLLDSLCLFYMRFPSPEKWTRDHINALLLYSLLFQEIYLFKIDIESQHMVFVAKNKKKISNESVYKKLVGLLSLDLNKYNLFNRGMLAAQNHELYEVYKKIMNIIQNNSARAITFDDMKYEITKVLELNTNTFF